LKGSKELSQSTRIIGIDPGSRYTGFGIIDRAGNRLKYIHSGVICCNKELDLSEKLVLIFDGIYEQIEKFQPQNGSIERIFHSVNAKTSLVLGHARGAALLAMKKKGLNISEHAPTEVKSAVVGIGKASKEQVSAMVRILLNIDRNLKMRDDESDALAVAICYANMKNFNNFCRTGSVPLKGVS